MRYLVFDVGGTAIKHALMNGNADILGQGEHPTPLDEVESFLDLIEGIYRQHTDIDGIALSLPGIVDSEHGHAYTGGFLSYNADKPIAELVRARCKIPVSVENDGKCAALAEAWKGSLADCNDAIVVVLGTGIGGGIIKNKAIHKGKGYLAGEFTFIITNTDQPKGNPLTIFAEQCGVPAGLCKPVAETKGMRISKVTGRTVFELANSGDREVLTILDGYCYKLALQLFNLQHIYNPEKIAIGGGISSQDILMRYIHANIAYIDTHHKLKLSVPNVVRCEFKNDANLIGALHHFKTLYHHPSPMNRGPDDSRPRVVGVTGDHLT